MKLKVEFEVSVEDGVTLEQATEWILFEVGQRGGMSEENPLCWTDIDAQFTTVTAI